MFHISKRCFLISNVLFGEYSSSSSDAVKICGNILDDECKAYDFSLENVYRDAADLSISYDIFKQNRPVQWEKFFKSLCGQTYLFDEKQLVSDILFQITYSLIHNDSTTTSFTIGIAEAVLDTCRSKKLIMMLQRLGLCKSYESL